MKIIKIIFLTLFALMLITTTVLFIFSETFDTDQYLPSISKKIALVFARPVSIAHLNLAYSWSGVVLDAGPVKVSDDPGFTSQPFIEIDKIRFVIDLKALILKHELHIAKIFLISPSIHFISSQSGQLNVFSVASVVSPVNKSPVTINKPQEEKINFKKLSSLAEKVQVDNLDIDIIDASISFISQIPHLPLDIWLKNIDARLVGFSLGKPFHVVLNANFYSNTSNVKGALTATVNIPERSVQIKDLDIQTNLNLLNKDDLKESSPLMANNPYLKDISGFLQLNLDKLNLGESKGIFAHGKIDYRDGLIKDFNIIKYTMSQALGSLGGIEINLDNLVNDKDTIINDAHMNFIYNENLWQIDEVLMDTNLISFTAKGSIDQGLNMDLQTLFHLNSDLSKNLVQGFDGLKYLLDDNQCISIGGSLNGVYPHLKFKPNKDFKKSAKKMWMAQGGNILGLLLGRK